MQEPNSGKIHEDSKEYKIPEIERFSGSPNKYLVFMAAIRRRFWENPNQFSTDHKKIDFISGHLTGSAMVWFDAIITENAPAAKNYEEFSAVFKSYFSDSGYALKSTNKLMKIFQGKRSVSEYAAEFRNLAIISEFNEKALIMQFQRGLNGCILDIHINSPLPKSINEPLDVCIDIDNRITSRETFKQKYIPKYDGQGYITYHNYPCQLYNKHWEISSNHEKHSINSQDGTPMYIYILRIRPRGPITLEERSRWLNNGLCLYCASDKHIVRDCKLFPHTLKAKTQH
ncbi:Retrotransposon-derived protein PEG10 [Smittium culicis]|uniref:Retrotransposon-derived protein PEG10 n=1 Tax=Smittium culicis TaxID=133412 RepID=A0A1R1X510_9FUNG|nr:Retrotransposon-derived protein PEG10 [Smittium culicis]